MQRGFTLIELSIVLIIIGLISGAVAVGQSVVRAGKIKKVTADMMEYTTAVKVFRDKYKGLPGDLYNADSFFDNCAANCNGDGDGRVEWSWGFPRECRQNFWQHMFRAGLITDAYEGVQSQLDPGVNVPASPYDGGVWLWCHTASYGLTFYGQSGNFLSMFGASEENQAHNRRLGRLITPEDAWEIDLKMDDGEPDTGRVLITKGLTGNTGAVPGCVDTDFRSATTATLDLQSDEPDCMIHLAVD